MKKPLFTGTCTALVTPFLNGAVNYPMAGQLLRRQITAGIKAVVLSGTTGESATLTDDEKLKLIQFCKEYSKDQCLIIAGTGSNSTAHAISMSVDAEKAGADAILVVTPYYNKANEGGLIAHYMAIAHSVSIPVIVYNVPSRTGVDIPISVYKRLSVIENIAGVKEASTDVTKIARIRSQCPDSFAVWAGNDDQIVPVMSLGGAGAISVVSNVLPEKTQAMTEAALAGDFDTAAALQNGLLPLIEILFSEVNPIPVKEVMKRIGFDCGGYRLPLTPPSVKTLEKIKRFLQ